MSSPALVVTRMMSQGPGSPLWLSSVLSPLRQAVELSVPASQSSLLSGASAHLCSPPERCGWAPSELGPGAHWWSGPVSASLYTRASL
eukprot:14350180-Heterocapsa_arctica.AAC.1